MRDGIAEILEARTMPGISVRQQVRTARMRDKNGRVVRTVYAGQEDTHSVERDMIGLAERDGVDLASAEMSVVEEHGQGVGKRETHTPQSARVVRHAPRPLARRKTQREIERDAT